MCTKCCIVLRVLVFAAAHCEMAIWNTVECVHCFSCPESEFWSVFSRFPPHFSPFFGNASALHVTEEDTKGQAKMAHNERRWKAAEWNQTNKHNSKKKKREKNITNEEPTFVWRWSNMRNNALLFFYFLFSSASSPYVWFYVYSTYVFACSAVSLSQCMAMASHNTICCLSIHSTCERAIVWQ